MEWTFGDLVLSIHSYLNGRILSYAFANVQATEQWNQFKKKFDKVLAKHIDCPDETTTKFLHLCVDNYENIIQDKLSFLNEE